MVVVTNLVAASGVSIAAGSLAVGLASYRESRKARKAREADSKGSLNTGRGPTMAVWQQGGREQVYVGADGSVFAVGHGPGDYSMGFVQTEAVAPPTAPFMQSTAMLMAEQRQREQQRQQYLASSQYPQGYIEYEQNPARGRLLENAPSQAPPTYDFVDRKSSPSNGQSFRKW